MRATQQWAWGNPPLSAPVKRDELFSAFIATAVDGIVITDAQGRVSVFNPACERLFGYSPKDALGRDVSMLVAEPFRSELDRHIAKGRARTRRRAVGIGRQMMGRRKDGSTFPMHLSMGEGVVSGEHIFVGIVHDLSAMRAEKQAPRADISGQRHPEEDITQLRNQLAHASRINTVGELSSALAHEMNQPLAAMTNYVNAARRWLKSPDGLEKAMPLLDKTLEQTARLGKIIQRLRGFLE